MNSSYSSISRLKPVPIIPQSNPIRSTATRSVRTPILNDQLKTEHRSSICFLRCFMNFSLMSPAFPSLDPRPVVSTDGPVDIRRLAMSDNSLVLSSLELPLPISKSFLHSAFRADISDVFLSRHCRSFIVDLPAQRTYSNLFHVFPFFLRVPTSRRHSVEKEQI